MTTIKEEIIVLLYALYMCGAKASKARATVYILSNHLLKPYDGDEDIVSTGETRIANRIAYARFDLKEKGYLSPSSHGTWAISQKGRERIEEIARRSLTRYSLTPSDDGESFWERFSDEFLKRLNDLGAELKKE